MTTLDAALAAPTAAEADELRQAVDEAVAAGCGFIAVHLVETGRIFTGLVLNSELHSWMLEPAADRAEAEQRAEARAREILQAVRSVEQNMFGGDVGAWH